DQPLPQLIIIDGGKGQLSSAMTSLKLLGIEKKVTVIGIAKRLEEIFYPGDSYPLYLDKKSETLKVIQQLRDEAHRFGITFHRKKRDQGTLKTELSQVPGIGKATADKLLQTFKSVKRIRETPREELLKVMNLKQVQALETFFNQETTN
ncbi:MAG: excinuclease ABC subunit C, partial [Chitinophagaceae bacterium]